MSIQLVRGLTTSTLFRKLQNDAHTRRIKSTCISYTIQVVKFEYTDVIFSNVMRWNGPVRYAVPSASCALRLLLRNVEKALRRDVKVNFCLTFVRPVLEYACVVLDTHALK